MNTPEILLLLPVLVVSALVPVAILILGCVLLNSRVRRRGEAAGGRRQ